MFNNIMKKLGKGESRRGMLSIEMIGVIAIIAIIVAGAAYYILTMNKDTKVSNTIAGMNMINTRMTEMQTIKNSDTDFATNVVKTLYDTGNIPATFNYDSGTISSPWGQIVIAPTAGSATEYTITLKNIPLDICKKMMPKFSKNNTPWSKIIQGTGSDNWLEGASQAGTFCGTAETVMLVFTGSR